MSGMPLPASLQKSVDATKVEYVQVGASGLRVSRPILGAMSLGTPKWSPWVLDEDASLEILKAAYDRGINTWDTANAYSNGASEAVIGKAIHKFNIPREKLVIMTKCCFHVGEDAEEPGMFTFAMAQQMDQSKDYVNQGGLSRTAIFTAVDASLARLGTNYIDLLQIHRYDPEIPPEETMRALHDLVQSGKVRYIGASSMWATQFAQLQFIAESNGWTKFVSMQNLYHLLYREEEREMIRFCKETGVGILPYSPMSGGKLAKPLGDNSSVRSKIPSPVPISVSEADDEIVRRVEEVAGRKGWSMAQVAMAWHKSKGAVPIVGFNSLERIEEACALREKTLSDEDVKYLEEPYVPKEIMGHF
ncbi:Aldo-keto reductase [Pleurostoma richardsiae]|uniref:Aldo-keto reductase n=1 Tax=Pleurostoma richardsiae TaxID=41990 RepID=A0AA38RWT6_9PEZI|nr:Aldo-keto reductase [Pleurostoma richardsiae]